MTKKQTYQIEYYDRPGHTLDGHKLAALMQQLHDVAATCFDQVPYYQCLVGSRESMMDKVIAVAWRPDGTAAGFFSAVILPVEKIGFVLHLGLTCVRPEDRSSGLTHQLTSKALTQHMLRYRPVGRMWISNVACVLSSLGNVALNFEDVYPSPLRNEEPSATHLHIAQSINRYHREAMAVDLQAWFDPNAFVFRRSVKGTVFQKKANDERFHHRNSILNQFYGQRMNFDQGDEVLQIGTVSLLLGVKKTMRSWRNNQFNTTLAR